MCVTYKRFCCCCCNVVTFSKVFAIFGLISGTLILIFGFLLLALTSASFAQLWAQLWIQLIFMPMPDLAIFGLISGTLILKGFLQLTVTSFSFSQLWVQLMLLPMPNLAIFVDHYNYYTGIVWIWIVITVVCMIPDVLLFFGISKKKPSLLIPWLVIRMILLVVC